jgi:hypothetical protein
MPAPGNRSNRSFITEIRRVYVVSKYRRTSQSETWMR